MGVSVVWPTIVSPAQAGMFVWPTFFAGWIVDAVLFRAAERRDRMRVTACDYMVCAGCRYDLRGLGEARVFPECRTEFERESLRAFWVKAWSDTGFSAAPTTPLEPGGVGGTAIVTHHPPATSPPR